MKKFATSLIVLLIMSLQILLAQNAGIVKGNPRTGRNSNFIQYDTAPGRLSLTKPNIYRPNFCSIALRLSIRYV